MNLALMSHDRRKELMVQFCIAYCGILSKHTVCATNGAIWTGAILSAPKLRPSGYDRAACPALTVMAAGAAFFPKSCDFWLTFSQKWDTI